MYRLYSYTYRAICQFFYLVDVTRPTHNIVFNYYPTDSNTINVSNFNYIVESENINFQWLALPVTGSYPLVTMGYITVSSET